MAWNGAGGAVQPQKRTNQAKPAAWRGLLAALVVIGGAALAYLYLFGPVKIGNKDANPKAKSGQIAEVEPAISPDVTQEEAAPETPKKPEPPPFVKRPGALQTPRGEIITFKPPAPGEEKFVYVHGRKYVVDANGNFEDVTPKPTFDNRFENTMEAMSAVGGGVLPAVALSISQEDIAKYMVSPIVINDDDLADIVEKKIATAEMKELFRDYLKDGGTWEEFVMELHHIMQSERMLQAQAISEIAKMLQEGDEEGAQLYHDKVDEFMRSKGYRGLKVPPKWGLSETPQPEVATEE